MLKFFSFLTQLFWILVIVLGVTFAGLNAHWVYLDYFLGTTHIFLPILLVCTLTAGALLGSIAMSQALWVARRRNRKLHQQLQRCQQELKKFNTLPFKGE